MIPNKIILNPRLQLIILLLIALSLNFNTLFNEYALDDAVVITQNKLVTEGLKGIPKILSTELNYGYDQGESDLSKARYRPISLVLFALEYQLWGNNPMMSHLINVLLFCLLIALLYQLLHVYIFHNQDKYLAFITCLLFVVHPIHAEVIANIKSGDEIITFILVALSYIALIKYHNKGSTGMLLIGLCCFLLALLTRESALPLIVTAPLILYFFHTTSLIKCIRISIPLFITFLLYLAIRFASVGFSHTVNKEVLNSPFLFATPSEAFASKSYMLIRYIWLLIYPFPLSFDYGYNQFPYIEINSIPFIISIIFIITLIGYAFLRFRDKSIVSFSILYFLATIFIFSNFALDIGVPLADRFLFQPSLAICILAAYAYIRFNKYFKLLTNGLLFIVLVVFSIKTVARNSEWKNNETLFFSDIKTTPNSVRANFFAAQACVEKAKRLNNQMLKITYLRKAVNYDEKAIDIYPHYSPLYDHIGNVFFELKDYLRAADYWLKFYKFAPSDSTAGIRIAMISSILNNEGNNYYTAGNPLEAIKYYRKSVELNYYNAEAWYNLGKCYFKVQDTKNGIESWQHAAKLNPSHQFETEDFR